MEVVVGLVVVITGLTDIRVNLTVPFFAAILPEIVNAVPDLAVALILLNLDVFLPAGLQLPFDFLVSAFVPLYTIVREHFAFFILADIFSCTVPALSNDLPKGSPPTSDMVFAIRTMIIGIQ